MKLAICMLQVHAATILADQNSYLNVMLVTVMQSKVSVPTIVHSSISTNVRQSSRKLDISATVCYLCKAGWFVHVSNKVDLKRTFHFISFVHVSKNIVH